MGQDTYYEILGVPPTATSDEIKVRYRTLIRKVHPDLDVPAALFRQVQEAYEVLSDPVRRAAYDRLLGSIGGPARTVPYARSGSVARERHRGSGSATRRPAPNVRGRGPARASVPATLIRPPWPLVMAGAVLVLLGAAFAEPGTLLILLGCMTLVIAGVVGLGVRGEKEREAYQRSGMPAVDAMTNRQFELLLKNLFANQGYWVARIGGRRELGSGLLVNGAHGRTIVQARQRNGVVDQDAVEEALAAMSRYRISRGLVVTSSDYSQQAVAVANTNGVMLWNRATLAAELTAFRGQPLRSGTRRISSELRAGFRICLGFVVAALVTLAAMGERARNPVDRADAADNAA